MELRISHRCPSCGGPVEMKEADRLTDCPFCDVQNYMVSGPMLRFMLPQRLPEHIDRADIIYFPYLRFKGNIYTCGGSKVGCKVLDTTHQGIEEAALPPSLGLRPQAMKLRLADDSGGRFIRQTERPATVLERAEKLARAFSDTDAAKLYHRAFIGETVSCLYLPLYIEEGTLFDGVLQRPLGDVPAWLTERDNLLAFQRQWRPRYLAMICPHCGDTMQGQPDSLVVHCYNCDTCWSEQRGRFIPVDFRLLEARRSNTAYLPFWRIRATSTGLAMNSFADLLSTANQPVVLTRHHRDQPLEFWIPALKIRPRVFLTLAKGATLSQLKYPRGEAKLSRRLLPVTLPLKEAVQAIKPVFGAVVVSRKDILPRLPRLKLTVLQTTLCFLPFEDTGHDYVQLHSGVSVTSSTVRLGRKL
jgi:hypothetical protein